MVGEEIANSKYVADVLMGAFVITNCTKLAGAPIPWRCRTLRTGSLGLTRPGHSRGDILFANPKLGEFGAYLFDTALLQRTQDDALPIRAHIEIFHAGEAGHHSFGERNLVPNRLLCQHSEPFQGNKEFLLPTIQQLHIVADVLVIYASGRNGLAPGGWPVVCPGGSSQAPPG